LACADWLAEEDPFDVESAGGEYAMMRRTMVCPTINMRYTVRPVVADTRIVRSSGA
jgi:hypothetical protein